MKFSAALLLAPFILLACAAPNASPATADEAVEEKIAAISVREVSPVELHARAPVTGTVNADGVRYRRCPHTSCEAVAQYIRGRVITIICRTQGENINGWSWWDRMDNGFYISDYYVDWTGGVPDVC
ncbi:hypothetical protein EST38_g10870 [Candolleomyces aberdarensis]|uniref:SH3 domain-containing protein n=1 Tax=Candolleomyces aberdarensis TaxID=2316362 RepID=A0A4Q2D6C2_9AGAR|nr:hypothetical protein EST38_g10870 [Candolleomyces aberdarensis]